jgi:hypothetical protein
MRTKNEWRPFLCWVRLFFVFEWLRIYFSSLATSVSLATPTPTASGTHGTGAAFGITVLQGEKTQRYQCLVDDMGPIGASSECSILHIQ